MIVIFLFVDQFPNFLAQQSLQNAEVIFEQEMYMNGSLMVAFTLEFV